MFGVSVMWDDGWWMIGKVWDGDIILMMMGVLKCLFLRALGSFLHFDVNDVITRANKSCRSIIK